MIIWEYLSHLGLYEGIDKSIEKKVTLSNRLSFFMLIMAFISTLVFGFSHGNSTLVYVVGSINLIPIITLLLNRYSFTGPSRMFFGIATPMVVLSIIVALKYFSDGTGFQVSEYHFYTPRYYLVALGLLPLTLIDLTEKRMFYAALLVNVVCLLLFDFAHDIAGVGHQTYGFKFHQYYQAQVMPVVLLFFLYGTIVFYQNENRKFENRITDLLTEAQHSHEQMSQEMMLAQKVIDGLIPAKLPQIPGVDMASFLRWSKQVGGDYYTVKEIDDEHYLMMVADVSGKGLAASIVVSTIHSYVETCLNGDPFELKSFVSGLNGVLCRIVDNGRFVTGWIAVYNKKTHTVQSMNAGHPAPLLLNLGSGKITPLDAGGTILGFFEDGYTFETEVHEVPENSLLFVYTDGVTEAANDDEVMYEENDGLLNFLRRNAHHNPHQILSDLQNDIRGFVGKDSYDDDLTCLVLKR